MENKYFDLIKSRRSHYVLKDESTLEDNQVVKLVENVLKYTPSAFNSQTARAVVLFGKHHHKLWDITREVLKPLVPDAKAFASTEKKMDSFKAAYGTILVFEEQNTVRDLEERFPLYKDNFAVWSEHSTGMVQLGIWLALHENKMGASLQHYNPIIDNEIQKEFNIPKSWKLTAQMPFGIPGATPGEKQFIDINERIKVFK